ncbi:unnamed protein product [Citrullus colocynthis]|uniref:Uncharacterized protein n=1 Tax=Citrullus colocynthis TaxID=252529 RepID=A0ABP0Z012_9ROSI
MCELGELGAKFDQCSFVCCSSISECIFIVFMDEKFNELSVFFIWVMRVIDRTCYGASINLSLPKATISVTPFAVASDN